MAVTAVTVSAHPAEPTDVTSGLTTLASTGSGNGFQIPYVNAYIVVLVNDSGSNATVTFKVPQPTEYSDRSITIPDDTVAINNGEHFTWIPNAIFKDSNENIEIEATQLIKCKVYSEPIRG